MRCARYTLLHDLLAQIKSRVDLACIGFYLCRTSEPERRKLALRPKDVVSGVRYGTRLH